MGSVAPEFTASSSMGSVAPRDASVSAPEITESKTPIGASTAAAPQSGTWASLLFAGSTSAAAAATSASPALYSTAIPSTPASSSSAGAKPNAALLPFIPPRSAFGAVEQADTAPSLEDLDYFENNPTIRESMWGLRSKAPTPQFREVKRSNRGGFRCGPHPGAATIPRVGINGFGRIGRLVARLILQSQDMQLVAVNDPFVSAVDMTKCLEDMPPALYPDIIKVFSIVEPENIPWANVGADYVVESTGIYTDMATASAHLKGGAKKVVICALSIEAPTFVYGVNENTYTPDIDIISVADSSTICVALLAKILHTTFGIKGCKMAITGQYSGEIKLTMALGSIIPDLISKFHVTVHYNPHVKLSCVEMNVKLDNCADYEMIKNSVRYIVNVCWNWCFQERIDMFTETWKECAPKELCTALAKLEGGVALKVTDYLGDCRSCLFDADAGFKQRDGSFKLFAWFNHERSYGQRCTDMILHMGKA